MLTHIERFTKAEAYLRARTGKYEWRCVRYNEVVNLLDNMGLNDDDLIIDIGAGYGDFDYFLRHERHFKGRYLPVDAALDGTELETWVPKVPASFIVGLEILEHLTNPHRTMRIMRNFSTKGCIATTPNPNVVDVLAMDKTHKTPISFDDFIYAGWDVYTKDCFGQKDDSLIAYLGEFDGKTCNQRRD